MFMAYLRSPSGTTSRINWQHTGQHVGVKDGKIRLAKLHWEMEEPRGLASATGTVGSVALETQARELLRRAVPLVDTLILTRMGQAVEQVVFHGLVQECSVDHSMVILVAVDNPAAERLFEHPFHADQELVPSDQEPAPPVQPVQPVQNLANLGGGSFLGARVQTLGDSSPIRPAGRPDGHPVGLPAQWERTTAQR